MFGCFPPVTMKIKIYNYENRGKGATLGQKTNFRISMEGRDSQKLVALVLSIPTCVCVSHR